DLDFDITQDRHRLLRRELVGYRPARRARDVSESFLQIDAVHLVDDAVDVVAQRRAVLGNMPIDGQHLIETAAEPGQGVRREAPPAICLVHPPLRRSRKARGLAPCVGEELERAACRYLRVELAK